MYAQELFSRMQAEEMLKQTYISVTLSSSLFLFLSSAEETWGRGKGQGPGEEVAPQEHTQLKLGLRLAFTVKIVDLTSPHRPLRKHMLYLSALGSF